MNTIGTEAVMIQEIEWDPQAAFEASEEQEKSKKRHDQIHWSIVKMTGTQTVKDCTVAHFDHDEASPKSPIVQYVEWLAEEVGIREREVERFGGAAAIEAYASGRFQADISYGGEVLPRPQPNRPPKRVNLPA